MKIATHNIMNGGNINIFDQQMLSNDFLALHEFQSQNISNFLSLLHIASFSNAQGPDVPTGRVNRNSVFVASKLFVVPVVKPNSINKVGHLWEECVVEDLSILSVHIPSSSGYWGGCKSLVWDAVYDKAKSNADKNFIIMGDLNTALYADCQAGSTTHASMILDLKNQLHYIDAWEYMHPGCVTNDRMTWYSRQNIGKRLDYVFLSPTLKKRLKAAEHIHHYRTSGLSDHSAVMVELS